MLKIEGEFLDIVCELNPEHRETVGVEIGVNILYIRTMKALYYCMKSVLLRNELYVKTLKSLGSVVDPYDMYTAKITIDGK